MQQGEAGQGKRTSQVDPDLLWRLGVTAIALGLAALSIWLGRA